MCRRTEFVILKKPMDEMCHLPGGMQPHKYRLWTGATVPLQVYHPSQNDIIVQSYRLQIMRFIKVNKEGRGRGRDLPL